jgi:hypothetical protein
MEEQANRSIKEEMRNENRSIACLPKQEWEKREWKNEEMDPSLRTVP